MLKTVILASSMLVAAPVLAQDAPATSETTTATPAATPQDAATPAATESNVADRVQKLVDMEWSKYDLTKTGVLAESEFGAWMTALRAKSDPSFDATSEEGQAWLAAVFKMADADESGSVSKPEMVAMLTKAVS